VYLTLVERPHGLPRAGRQVRDSARGPVYRDVLYRRLGQVVELDGRLFHDSARLRDADLDRDLAAAADGLSTVRIGWGQVFERSCRTAWLIAALLRERGWAGAPASCPRCTEGDRHIWKDGRAAVSPDDIGARLSRTGA
jgi:hypothetical protein